MQHDPRVILLQVQNLKLTNPELLEEDETWLASLESETDFHEALTTIVRRIEDTRELEIGAAERLEELSARKKRFSHRIETLRNLAFKIMQAAELAKIELPEATLSLRAGTQQLVGDAHPDTLPDALCKISRDLNRTAIKDALKTGAAVPGFALSNSPPSLSIRVK